MFRKREMCFLTGATRIFPLLLFYLFVFFDQLFFLNYFNFKRKVLPVYLFFAVSFSSPSFTAFLWGGVEGRYEGNALTASSTFRCALLPQCKNNCKYFFRIGTQTCCATTTLVSSCPGMTTTPTPTTSTETSSMGKVKAFS